MGLILAFAVGYVVGARAGSAGLEEISESLSAVRESPEIKGVISAMRSHGSSTLRDLAERVDEGDNLLSARQLLDRLEALFRR